MDLDAWVLAIDGGAELVGAVLNGVVVLGPGPLVEPPAGATSTTSGFWCGPARRSAGCGWPGLPTSRTRPTTAAATAPATATARGTAAGWDRRWRGALLTSDLQVLADER
jgi:hypothetical protein